MKRIIKELQGEIETDTELSFTVPKRTSSISDETDSEHAAESGASPQYVDSLLTDDAVTTMEGWLDDGYLHTISEKTVITELDDILLLLIAVRGEACGKELLHDIRRLFGADLSPGTVYPHLTDLADEDLLAMTEQKTRKVYWISDIEDTFDRVESTVNRTLTLSLVLKALLIDCKPPDSQLQRSEMNE